MDSIPSTPLPTEQQPRMAPPMASEPAVAVQDPLTPPITAPVSPPPPAPNTQPRNMSSIIIAILSGIIVLGIVGFIFMQYNAGRQTTQVAEPTPTVFPTPTPVLQLSQIATTSAFLSFTEHVASLSAQINGFSLQDGALNPPALDTEITFNPQ